MLSRGKIVLQAALASLLPCMCAQSAPPGGLPLVVVTTDRQTIRPDGESKLFVRVKVIEAFSGADIRGAKVFFDADCGEFSDDVQQTDAVGEATASFSTAVPGPARVYAYVGRLQSEHYDLVDLNAGPETGLMGLYSDQAAPGRHAGGSLAEPENADKSSPSNETGRDHAATQERQSTDQKVRVKAPPIKPVSNAELARDPRLQSPLSLDGETRPLAETAAALQAHTSANLMVQGDLLTQPAALALRKQPCWMVMRTIADAFDARWYRRKDDLILISDQELARVILAGSSTDPRRKLQTFVKSLLPGQRKVLGIAGRLRITQMTPEQRELFRAVLAGYYSRSPHRFTRGLLQGSRVILALAGAGSQLSAVRLQAPVVTAAGELMLETIDEIPLTTELPVPRGQAPQ